MRTFIGISASVFFLMILTFIIHEGAHFLTAKALGNEAILSINHVRPATGEWNRPSDAFRITTAGPMSTILLGLLGFVWAISRDSILGLNIVLVAFVHRLMATIVSLNNANDEMRMSIALGWGSWTLPIAVVSTLLLLSIIAYRKTEASYHHLLGLWLGSSLAITLVVIGEPFFPSFTG